MNLSDNAVIVLVILIIFGGMTLTNIFTNDCDCVTVEETIPTGE